MHTIGNRRNIENGWRSAELPNVGRLDRSLLSPCSTDLVPDLLLFGDVSLLFFFDVSQVLLYPLQLFAVKPMEMETRCCHGCLLIQKACNLLMDCLSITNAATCPFIQLLELFQLLVAWRRDGPSVAHFIRVSFV